MSWRPLLTGVDGERARAVSLEAASRLAGRGQAAEASSEPGLGRPASSIALLCAQLDRLFPDAGWDRAGHEHLTAGARAAESAGTPLGLFDGIAGLGYAAHSLAAGRRRYGALLTAIDQALAEGVAASRAALAGTSGLPVRAWDLISGITGVGVYLLARRTQPVPLAALDETLATLVDLTRETEGTPRWATPPEYLHEYMRETAPAGNLNCGLAHGAPGPLALMSLALLEGVEVSGQRQAARQLADWVAAQCHPGRFGPEWPVAVALGATRAGRPQPLARPGWCYGNAGVARALWLAGKALDEPEHARLAERALRGALEHQRTERPLDTPLLCHGSAGLTQVTLRMAADSGAEDLSRGARRLSLELVERFHPEEIVDSTLLEGAAGPPLVLLAAATDTDPGWDRAMLLS